MTVITSYGSGSSGPAAGARCLLRLVRREQIPMVHFVLPVAVLLCCTAQRIMGFETNPPPASGQIEQTNLQEVLRTFLRLQEQLQATQASIEQNREEARKAAAQGGEALSKGLQ